MRMAIPVRKWKEDYSIQDFARKFQISFIKQKIPRHSTMWLGISDNSPVSFVKLSMVHSFSSTEV